jgi:hypothetical protein
VLAEFFRALTTHKEVKTAYQNWQQGAVLINDMRSGFSYSGITFEEYRGQASFVQADGTLGTRRFIAAGEAHAFPLGTVDTFATYFAPADFNETVNTSASRCTPSRSRASSTGAPICTRNRTRCRCATARAC